MAHSHQQTLLAKLGFSDPDHKDPRHTLACEYLCKPEVSRKVVSVLQDFASGPTEQPKPVRYPKQDDPAYKEWFLCSEAQTEAPVMNRNYYIGFIDVMIKYVTGGWSTSWGRGPDEVHKCNREYLVIVEVKVSKVDPADIIKQMKLYATYAINSLPEYDVRQIGRAHV